MSDGIVYSGESNIVIFDFQGYKSADGLSIYCQADSICNVTCGDQGCTTETSLYKKKEMK